MISDHTRDAIVALLSIDKTATEAEKQRVAEALSETPDAPAVVSYTTAGKRLGVTRQTIHNLVRRGKLKSVTGAGTHGRPTGILVSSISQYLLGA